MKTGGNIKKEAIKMCILIDMWIDIGIQLWCWIPVIGQPHNLSHTDYVTNRHREPITIDNFVIDTIQGKTGCTRTRTLKWEEQLLKCHRKIMVIISLSEWYNLYTCRCLAHFKVKSKVVNRHI